MPVRQRFARVLPLALLLWGMLLGRGALEGFRAHVRALDWRNFQTGGAMVLHGAGRDLESLEAQLAWQRKAWPELEGEKDLLPFMNPPFFAAVLAPFAIPAPETGYVAWTFVLAGLLAVLVAHVVEAAPDARSALLLAFAFPPAIVALAQGQPSFLLALAFFMAWKELGRGRDLAAGLWLSALLVKPHFVLVPAAALAWKRRPRALAGLGAGALLLGLVSLAVSGPGFARGYVELLRTAMNDSAIETFHPARTHALRGVLCALLGARATVPWLAGAALSGAALFAALRARSEGSRFDLEWALVVLVTAFAAPHLFFHDLSVLLVAGTLLARARSRAARWLIPAGSLAAWAHVFLGPDFPSLVVPVEAVAIGFLAAALASRRAG